MKLADARAVAAVAAARYRDDRELLAAVMVEAYTTGSTGPFGMLFSADTDQDLVTGMMMLQEMGRSQSKAVTAAQRSRDQLRATAAAVAEAARRAAEGLEASKAALTRTETARGHVLAEVAGARALLEDSVLADQVAAARTALQRAAVSPESATTFVAGDFGDFGDVSFPLPAEAAFVDQDIWGHRSDHWSTVHTGDDFSAACGTIGAVGAEGNATGCHLHFELHPNGGTIFEDNADPAAWFHATGVYPGDR